MNKTENKKCIDNEPDNHLAHAWNVNYRNAQEFYLIHSSGSVSLEIFRIIHKLKDISGYKQIWTITLTFSAYKERKIRENPNGFLDRIDTIPTMKEHLSKEELIRSAAMEGDMFGDTSFFKPFSKWSFT